MLKCGTILETSYILEKVKAVVITDAGKNFCSVGDISEIIGTLTKMSMKGITCYYQNNWRFS